MSRELLLENPRTGAVRPFHPGFDWMLFLFSGVFGIPLFLRRLWKWGTVFVGLWLIDAAVVFLAPKAWSLPAQAVLAAIFFALQLWLGLHGRERILDAYLARGWRKRERAPRPRQGRKPRP